MPTALPPSFAYRPARLLAACTATLFVAGVGGASPAAAADSVSYDFESPSQKLPFMAINGFGRVLVGPAPGGKSGQAARVNIPNDGRSFKSELVIKGLDAGSHRFSFANYLPGDWQERDLDTIVAQWFSTQGDGEGIKPVVALSVHGGNWQLKVHWMSGGAIQESVIPLGAARPGHWNRWGFDITWSSAAHPVRSPSRGTASPSVRTKAPTTTTAANRRTSGSAPTGPTGVRRRGPRSGPEQPRRSSSSTTSPSPARSPAPERTRARPVPVPQRPRVPRPPRPAPPPPARQPRPRPPPREPVQPHPPAVRPRSPTTTPLPERPGRRRTPTGPRSRAPARPV